MKEEMKEEKREEKKEEEKEYYQAVHIEFTDGRRIDAVIPAQFFKDEDLEGITIKKFTISKPKVLPEDYSFSSVGKDNNS